MLAMEHRGSSEKATCAVWLTLIPVACGIMSTARTRWTTRSLGQIFAGLAMSGSWGCFDELSRIPVDVLLVVTVLSAEGLLEARDLAKKFVTLYRLDRQLLSAFERYDCGLRAVRSVLVMAGALKRGGLCCTPCETSAWPSCPRMTSTWS